MAANNPAHETNSCLLDDLSDENRKRFIQTKYLDQIKDVVS